MTINDRPPAAPQKKLGAHGYQFPTPKAPQAPPELGAKAMPGAPIPPERRPVAPPVAAPPSPAPAVETAEQVEAPAERIATGYDAARGVYTYDDDPPAPPAPARQTAPEPVQSPATPATPIAPPAETEAATAPLVLSLDGIPIAETQDDDAEQVITSNERSSQKIAREKKKAERASGATGKSSSVPSSAAGGSPPPREDGTTGAGKGEEPPAAATLMFTDLGNAERLARDHADSLRYCPAWESWLTWTGARWAKDETGEVMRRAKATVRSIPAELASLSGREWKDGMKHAMASESAKGINAMVNLGRWHRPFPVQVKELDAHDFLFNCANGTIDLHTGELRPHRREDMLTKASPVVYDPEARSELWETFLREALDDDAEVVEYLKRAVGYSLTGDVSLELLFFVYGPGGGGKSTFLEAVRTVLGDYAVGARFEMFLRRTGDAPSANPDEARLCGARFVPSIETDKGKKLSEGTIKRLTGGDIVTARELYSRAFDFKPTFKVWLAANDAPRVNDDDEALFRRVRRIGFNRARTAEGSRDPRIKASLVDHRVSGSAILAWAVEGCLAWQRDGLKTPAAVLASTDAYRAENDPLTGFFDARVTFDQHAVVPRKDMRDAYEAWERTSGSGILLSPKEFTRRLRARLAAEHGASHELETTKRVHGVKSPVLAWRGAVLVDPAAAVATVDHDGRVEGRGDAWEA